MISAAEIERFAREFLDAWNSHDVERVIATYTEELTYVDPNTRGPVKGRAAMRSYLTRLFGAWRMHWTLRDGHPLSDCDGAAVLWHASFRRIDGEKSVEIDGMDLVVLEQGRIQRNEVYFDRAALAPLLS